MALHDKLGCQAPFAKGGVMTVPFRQGQFGVRYASTPDDLAACQALRHQCFFGRVGLDADRFDATCQHLMVANDAGLVATARLNVIAEMGDLSNSYTAQSYELDPLFTQLGPFLEMGRFCIAASAQNADVLRLAWGALADFVDRYQIKMIFGCSSFSGVDASAHARAFSLLAARYQSGAGLPRAKADEVVPLVDLGLKGGAAELPPLLRSYLAMGGKVGDQAVIDRALQTIHVFTALDVAAIPPARARALRQMCV